MSDLISRQAAIDAINKALDRETLLNRLVRRIAVDAVRELLSAQPEEDCGTCKHGIFGSTQCDNCRVRYPSHYERRTDDGE